MVSGDGEMSAPRDEAAAGSATNEGSSAMVATSGGGEADELIDEVARSEVNERGDAMAATSGGDELNELIGGTDAAFVTRTPRSRGSKGQKHGRQRREERNAKKRGE